ncbi:hypothetical protein [Chamaesiphon polymorphus]|uniref:Uncharacterized protein n=1 Tax=Chamaesiphon polymorphus CCALA 037 TaxID=2107692 RepID=A0A2T1G4J2_9CYAN|nr:hypothetical protein [Chamaesiphon polymorphus]PSB52168.1 hypothetical protein C7B77_20790 [Chamaesiphon polymorphus CCALA 037]
MISSFELWLETEEYETDLDVTDPCDNFCSIAVTLADGRRYAMNVWTFNFLPLARYDDNYDIREGQEPAKYVLPPDLFVERLDRATLETVIVDLLAKNLMNPNWLCQPD